MISALLFDLDDTIFEQADWLAGAWRAVASAGALTGVDGAAFLPALEAVAAEGSDRGRIIDRALERIGVDDVDPRRLVDAFRAYRPAVLSPFPGAPEALAAARRAVPIGLVTDGDVGIQRGKLDALGLNDAFDVVILSDELGRAHRKPDPAPFAAAARALGVAAAEVVFIGDRPDKDILGANNAGFRSVRVRTGEYRDRPDDPPPWRSAPDVATAVAQLEPELAGSPVR